VNLQKTGSADIKSFMKSIKYRHELAGEYIQNPEIWKRLWIVTGGQSGVDRAALDVALELRLPARGWAPLEHDAEDGKIPEHYPLQETLTKDPALRTELNAFDSDATLVISAGVPKDGTGLTEEMAKLYNKPLRYIDMEQELSDEDILNFRSWIEDHHVRILNIAGPRESHRPGYIYKTSREIITKLLIKG
jgi:hypothetical protein